MQIPQISGHSTLKLKEKVEQKKSRPSFLQRSTFERQDKWKLLIGARVTCDSSPVINRAPTHAEHELNELTLFVVN